MLSENSGNLPESKLRCVNCEVTLIVVPRERFSCTQKSLESIYENTKIPFKLIYIDGNSPKEVQRYLREKSQLHGFQIIRTDHYVPPNHARNLGLKHLDTRYAVFIDNDVVVSPGWLEALVNCANETHAAVVGPLMCQDEPLHKTVHFAGGESHIFIDMDGKRRLREKMYLHLKHVKDVQHCLRREPTELVEFHCMLVRTDFCKQLGGLDTNMLSTKEHMDFCMSVAANGQSIYFEPSSVVTYLPGPPQSLADVRFYMIRWSDAWARASLDHLQEKWNLTTSRYFENTYVRARSRRKETIVMPLCRYLSLGRKNRFLLKLLRGFEKYLNRYLTSRYARNYLNQTELE